MNYMNQDIKREHTVRLTDRKRLEMTAIDDVDGFTENTVSASSAMGDIVIDGEGLKIESFGSDSGVLIVSGNIDAFYYYDKKEKRKGLFSRGK